MKTIIIAGAIGMLSAITTSVDAQGTYDCSAMQQQLMQEMQALSTRVDGMGMCAMTREIAQFYPRARDFYANCPAMDPDGSLRRYSEEMIRWAQDVAPKVCN